jgi:hypothetical protein
MIFNININTLNPIPNINDCKKIDETILYVFISKYGSYVNCDDNGIMHSDIYDLYKNTIDDYVDKIFYYCLNKVIK